MKTLLIWAYLLTKRILHKPLFLLTLILIPAFVLILRLSIQTQDAPLQVALYTDTSDANSLESELVSKLLDSSNNMIQFYLCDSLLHLQTDIQNHRAACGYVIPDNLEDKLQQYESNGNAIISSYRQTGEITTRLIDEMIYSGIYQELAYDIAARHIYEKTNTKPDTRLRSLYDKYRHNYTFIQFEYVDSTKNEILNRNDTNYMLLPIRGITAALILLTGMTGTIFWYDDHASKIFFHLSARKQHQITLLYSLIPALLAGIAGIIAILLTGFARQILQEGIAMLLFLLGVCAFCMLLREILPSLQLYLTAIPICVIGSILLCPIFANLTSKVPLLKPFRLLTPVYYYLRSIYSTRDRWHFIIYSVVFFSLALFLRKLPELRSQKT